MAPNPKRKTRETRSRKGSCIFQIMGIGKKKQVISAMTPNTAVIQTTLDNVK